MKLQAKFLLLFIFLFGTVAVLLVLQRSFDLGRSQSVLQSDLAARHQYFEKITHVEGHPLESLAVDYSFWDEMVNFIKKRNLQFARDNIDSGLSTYGADAAWVYRLDNSLVYFKSIPEDNTLEKLGLPKAFFDQLYLKHFAHFYLQKPNGLLEIQAATVHPGDDSDRKTPPQGFWVVGRYLTPGYVASLGDLTGSTITINPATAQAGDQFGTNTVSFGSKLPGWDSRPVAVITSKAEVPVVKVLENLYSRQLILLLLVSLASILAVIISISLLVLRPVREITVSLKNQTPSSLDRLAKKNTEFGSLASTVQQFFTSEFLKTKMMELNTAKSEFLAIAAHELKGPVGNVHIFAENLADLVRDSRPKAELLDEVQRISMSAHKATVLINDIYQASKGGQAIEIKRTNFDFDAFVQAEVADAQYSTKQRIIIEGSTGKKVTSDIDRLGQVMTNLIRNASKYSPDADKIVVRLAAQDSNIVLEIQDFGLGISSDDLPKLFERFFRSSSVATSYPGLGLGLSICTEIIEALGGKIWVTSEIGQGSHFYFSIPLNPEYTELS
jgi:signal transduction histidine kinase